MTDTKTNCKTTTSTWYYYIIQKWFSQPTDFFLSNACKYGEIGERCTYSHPVICKEYKAYGASHQIGCQQDANCRYFYPVLCSSATDTQDCFKRNCRFWHIKCTKRVQLKLDMSEQYLLIDQSQVPFLWEQIKVIHHQLHHIILSIPGNWRSLIPPPPLMRQNQH